MLKNYVKIALRHLRRNISYTFINLAGLTLGVTGSIILFLMVWFLTSFDQEHPAANRTYRIVHTSQMQDRVRHGTGLPNPMPGAVAEEITGIETVLRISSCENMLVRVESQPGQSNLFEEENGIAYTEAAYFELIQQPLLAGSGLLNQPYQAVIGRSLAQKYFGSQEPVGKTLRIDNQFDVTITGIMADPLVNSSFPFELLISWATVRESRLAEGWGSVSSSDQCFVRLSPGTNPQAVNNQFPAFVDKYQKSDIRAWSYRLQPITALKYDPELSNFRDDTVTKESIGVMVVIALFLVLTACINFVNLNTAVLSRRMKEAGIRKVLGSQRRQLIIQHLCETAMLTALAIVLSAGCAELALLKLNPFLKMHLHIKLFQPSQALFFAATWIVLSLVAGLYPAYLVARYKPVLILKNNLNNRAAGGFMMRRTLVVMQFAISQVLLIGTIIVLSQMSYLQHKDLGFQQQATIGVHLPEIDNLQKKRHVREAVRQFPGVEAVSLCFRPPSSGENALTDITIEGVEDNVIVYLKATDDAYVNLFDLTLLAGHNLPTSDTVRGVLINERTLKLTGVTDPQDALGRRVGLWDYEEPIVGVVKDFNTRSLRTAIDPVVLYNDLSEAETLVVRLTPGHFKETLAAIESAWKAQYPNFLFSYYFMDQKIGEFYEDVQKDFTLLTLFSGVAIFIGCLGLYGLVSFMAHQKEKEMGVRKVLGATTTQIMMRFSREFVVLTLIACLLSIPVAGYYMNQWLADYAYHIPLNGSVFILAVLITLCIALLTVSYRSFRAADKNPADVLKAS